MAAAAEAASGGLILPPPPFSRFLFTLSHGAPDFDSKVTANQVINYMDRGPPPPRPGESEAADRRKRNKHDLCPDLPVELRCVIPRQSALYLLRNHLGLNTSKQRRKRELGGGRPVDVVGAVEVDPANDHEFDDGEEDSEEEGEAQRGIKGIAVYSGA